MRQRNDLKESNPELHTFVHAVDVFGSQEVIGKKVYFGR